MHQKTKDIQKRYEGFLLTNCLWKGNDIYNLNQFEIEPNYRQIDSEINENLRLGKYIERFVSFELQQDSSIRILAENIQIQQEKRTLGELDCILSRNNQFIHLEVIYKFYLYDKSVGSSEIEHFIGPNKKDSLVEKLNKLTEKQLPLLYSNECKEYLESINLKSSKIDQQVYFKAQLFVPFSDQKVELTTLNKDCIVGFYINKKELKHFIDCKFYIPNKKDWLIAPHKNVNWSSFSLFKEISEEYLNRKFSPLCWIKHKNGEVKKVFLVWW